VDGFLLDFSNSGGNSNHNVSSPFHHFEKKIFQQLE
jgi:hypothetical protein